MAFADEDRLRVLLAAEDIRLVDLPRDHDCAWHLYARWEGACALCLSRCN